MSDEKYPEKNTIDEENEKSHEEDVISSEDSQSLEISI